MHKKIAASYENHGNCDSNFKGDKRCKLGGYIDLFRIYNDES